MRLVTTVLSLGRRARKLARILVTPAYRDALRHGVAAAVEHQQTPLPRGLRTVLDVGAHRGQFALVAAHRWPDAAIVCFEPLQDAQVALERVLRAHPRSRVIGVALSDTDGMARLHVSRSDDSSSLLPITQRQVAAFPGTDEIRRLKVQTARLDQVLAADAIDRPALLKIDVQGAELAVLRGAVGLLPAVDAIVVECSFSEFYAGQALADDVIRFLHAHGFALTALGSPSTDARGDVLQADLVFTPRDLPQPPATGSSGARPADVEGL